MSWTGLQWYDVVGGSFTLISAIGCCMSLSEHIKESKLPLPKVNVKVEESPWPTFKIVYWNDHEVFRCPLTQSHAEIVAEMVAKCRTLEKADKKVYNYIASL